MEEDTLIIANGWVLTCDPRDRAGRLSILVRDGKISDIEPDAERLALSHPRARVVDAHDRLIIPGLVNAHYHTDRALFGEDDHCLLSRAEEQAQLPSTVPARPEEPNFNDDLRAIFRASYYRHIKSGTTCVGEFPPPVDGAGFRALAETIEQTPVSGVLVLQNRAQIDVVRTMALGRRRILVNAGSEEECTASRLATQARIARELRAPLIVHIGERRGSMETLAQRFRKPVLQLLHGHNVMHASTVLVHLNHCSEEDVAFVEKVGCTLTLCARGAARKKNGFPLIRHLSGHSLKLCVGTDSVDVDMLAELRFLRELPLLFADVPEFSSLDLLRMATINGAHALHLHEKTGSIERGKRADLVFFSLSDVRIPPLADDPSAQQLADLLVDDLSVYQISEVMSGGRFAVVDGKLTMQNEAEIIGGLRSTLAHWSSSAGPSPVAGPQERARVPYVDVKDVAGWWSGYFTGDLSSLPRAPVIPPAPSPQPGIPGTGLSPTSAPVANLPELTRDVRRVFGEDDEF